MQIKHALLVLSLSLLSACSAGFTYNQLDWLIPWYVDDYVDLNSDQKVTLQSRVDSLLAWHRGEELVRYQELLDRIRQDVRTRVNTDTVRSWINEAWHAAERIEATALPAALAFGENISDEQMTEFIDSLWQRQRELEEEYLERSNSEYAVDAYERIEDNLGRFIGSLNGSQELRLQQAVESLQRYDRTWLQGRELWLKKLEPLLKARAPGWQQAVLHAHNIRNEYRPLDYYALREFNITTISAAIADIINSLEPRQRERLFNEINDLHHELGVLIETGKQQV